MMAYVFFLFFFALLARITESRHFGPRF
jgi:hypothetical protein